MEPPATEPFGESPDDPPRAPRRRRWLRRLIFALLALLFLLVLISAILILRLPWILTNEWVQQQAVSALKETLGIPCVQVRRVNYLPPTGVELLGVELCPPGGFVEKPFTADRIALRYDQSQIRSAHLTVNEVAIESPHVIVE